MTPIRNDDCRNPSIHADFDFVDTQPFDSDSPSCGGEHDVCDDTEWQYFEDTVPLDDDVTLETEVVNLAGETQVLEIGGETQVLDDFDSQLLDEGSESDRTQVLENVDNDGDCGESADSKEVVGEPPCGHGDKTGPVASQEQQTSSGSGPPRFTYLRAESLREAALARNRSLKQTQNETTSVMGMSQSFQEPLAAKDDGKSFPRCSEKVRGVAHEYEQRKSSLEIEGFKDKNICKLDNSAVRKLFNDDVSIELDGPSLSSNDLNEGDDLDKLPDCHGEFVGLSYANSQEPGELSQVNALDFVDRFLKDNIMEFDQETNHVKNVKEKSKPLPCANGQHSLAKRINDKGKDGKSGIYDWDDSCEDEGGGDIYQRRKEDFFKGESHRPRSLPGFQKLKVRRLNDDKDEEQRIPSKRKAAAHSDSRLGMLKLKVRDNTIQEATRNLRRNLANELDEQLNTNCSRGGMEPNANEDAWKMLDVGIDTQMAAEAMEALCNVEGIVENVANDATPVTRSSLTSQLTNSSTAKPGLVTSKEHSGKYGRKKKVNVKSNLQTSGLSKKCTKEVRQYTKDNMVTRSKSKFSAEGNQNSSAKESGRVVSSTIMERIKSAGALKRHHPDMLNNPDGNDRGSRGSVVDEGKLQGELWHFTPIARRTRNSLAVNQLINPDVPSKSLREGDNKIGSIEKSSVIDRQASEASESDPKSTPGSSDHLKLNDNSKLCQLEKLAPQENIPDGNDRRNGGSVVNGRQLQGEVWHFTPIARRTRKSLAVTQLINPDVPSKGLSKGDIGIGSTEKSCGIDLLQASKGSESDPISAPGSSDHLEVNNNSKLCQVERLAPQASAVSVSCNVETDTLNCPRRRRSLRIMKFSNHDKESEKLVESSKPSAQPEDIANSTTKKRKVRTDSVAKSHVDCLTHGSSYGGSVTSCIDQKHGKISDPNLDKVIPDKIPICSDVMDEKDANLNSDESPRERYRSSDLASATPANCKTPVNDASPVCMGDDYYKKSRNRNVSRSCVFRKELHRELRSLNASTPESLTPSKDSRKRKDMTDVRVLYSHHLDEDIVKHQKRILERLGVSVASSIADATHFVADQFVRTRNMLEAIAFGKPVVTHLWIESCGEASCFIDERNYMLRDVKKEKEFGFSMPVSLARASQHALLEGRRVLITPNTKPSKVVISSLVNAVQGQAVERVSRSSLKDHKIQDDLLILSCEEDYAFCVPFLEKGAMVYSSELLLNGIVTQKLEYQRYLLFADHVKKTRSTTWLKRENRKFTPVTKCD